MPSFAAAAGPRTRTAAWRWSLPRGAWSWRGWGAWPGAAAVFASALCVLGGPELAGRLLTPAGAVWTGSPDVVNYPTYLAKIAWGAAGHWTYSDTMTPEPTRPVPIYLPYLLLGHLRAWLGGSAPGWFQGARVVLAACAAALWWAYCRGKWPGGRGALAFWAGLFAGPWVWDALLPLGRTWAAFDWWPGGHAAQILTAAPHYGILGTCMVAVLWLGERARDGARPREGGGWPAGPPARGGRGRLPARALAWIPACLAEAALSTTYPWLCALPLLAPWGGVRSRAQARRLLPFTVLAGAGALPYGLALLWCLHHVPWLGLWRQQSAMAPAPLPVVLGLGYGAAGPLAVAGSALALRRGDPSAAEMAAWAAAAIAASYVVPLPNAREMTVLLSLPLGALAAGPLFALLRTARGWRRALCSAGAACALGPGAAAVAFGLVAGPLATPWQPAAVAAAIRHVAAADPGAVVLADPGTSLWIPVWSGDRLRPYVAHPQETLQYGRRQAGAEAFWEEPSPQARAAWLRAHRIQWVIWDASANARLRRLALPGWNPWPASPGTGVAGARLVWSAGGASVWWIPPGRGRGR